MSTHDAKIGLKYIKYIKHKTTAIAGLAYQMCSIYRTTLLTLTYFLFVIHRQLTRLKLDIFPDSSPLLKFSKSEKVSAQHLGKSIQNFNTLNPQYLTLLIKLIGVNKGRHVTLKYFSMFVQSFAR